jgi:hypothetical protein
LAALSSSDGYRVASIMQKISDALVRNGIRDVYGFGNSWSLVQHPEFATVLDAWVAAGHHVGNHTRSHLVLTEIGWERYCGEIDLADRHLPVAFQSAKPLLSLHALPLG